MVARRLIHRLPAKSREPVQQIFIRELRRPAPQFSTRLPRLPDPAHEYRNQHPRQRQHPVRGGEVQRVKPAPQQPIFSENNSKSFLHPGNLLPVRTTAARQQPQQNRPDETAQQRDVPTDFELIHQKRHSALQQRRSTRQRRNAQHQKEQSPPQPAEIARHLVERRRQNLEDQTRTRTRRKSHRKHRRKNRQPRHDRRHRVQKYNPRRRRENILLLLEITPIRDRDPHPETQRVKGVSQRLKHTARTQFGEIRFQEEFNPRVRSRQRHRPDQHRHQQEKQHRHQAFRPAFNAAANSAPQHDPRNRYEDQKAGRHTPWILQIFQKDPFRLRRRREIDPFPERTVDIIENPAADHRVIGENQHRRDQRKQSRRSEPEREKQTPEQQRKRRKTVIPSVQKTQRRKNQKPPDHFAERRTFQLQRPERPVRILPGVPPERHFAEHQRHADQKNAAQIYQYECASAVLTGDVGKFPDVAEADRRAGGHQNEAQIAAPGVAFRRCHDFCSNRFRWSCCHLFKFNKLHAKKLFFNASSGKSGEFLRDRFREREKSRLQLNAAGNLKPGRNARLQKRH